MRRVTISDPNHVHCLTENDSQELHKNAKETGRIKSLPTPLLTREGDVETLIGHGEV